VKVLQLAKYPPSSTGGIEKLSRQVSSILSTSDLRIDILCFADQAKSKFDVYYSYTVYKARTLLRFLSVPLSIHNLYFLRKLAASYDLFHLHLPNPTSALYALFLPHSIPITVHFHAEVRNLPFYSLYSRLESLILSRSKLIIVTSNNLSACPTLAPFIHKTRVIPLGLSREDYVLPPLSVLPEHILELSSGKYFMFLGRFSSYKNIPILLDAFARHLCSFPDHTLILAGSGRQLNDILRHVSRLKLNSSVYILDSPNEQEKKHLLSKAIALVLPSSTMGEAFGYVQLEAMAMRTPVISVNIPFSGVSEINIDNTTGIVLPSPSSASLLSDHLCHAMDRLASDSILVNKLSDNAYQHAKSYQASNLLRAMPELFKKALE